MQQQGLTPPVSRKVQFSATSTPVGAPPATAPTAAPKATLMPGPKPPPVLPTTLSQSAGPAPAAPAPSGPPVGAGPPVPPPVYMPMSTGGGGMPGPYFTPGGSAYYPSIPVPHVGGIQYPGSQYETPYTGGSNLFIHH